jgi:hypothetical protein
MMPFSDRTQIEVITKQKVKETILYKRHEIGEEWRRLHKNELPDLQPMTMKFQN